MKNLPLELQNSYDRVAKNYAAQFKDELSKKPFDCRMLERMVEKIGKKEMICDLGCGAGHIAGYLKNCGAKVCGIDLSPGMVEQARRLNPEISFRQGNMLDLNEIADNSFGGVAAFYSIIHIPKDLVITALREIKRVLQSDGTLLLTFHIGQETRHLDEFLGEKVSLDFFFFETEEMKSHLDAAGFEIEEAIEREPIPEVEVQTRRAYIFARKP
jgi:ubiquinone/menaquinone biosynthesis C-methylase UbiE